MTAQYTAGDRLSDYDYTLPDELIAQNPPAQRGASRLLWLPQQSAHQQPTLEDRLFTDLPDLLRAGDLLVMNNSKVIPARLQATKPTGGRVELLVERMLEGHRASCLLKASRKPQPGDALTLVPNLPSGQSQDSPPVLTLIGRDPDADDRFLLEFPELILPILQAWGALPLPPYIEHAPTEADQERYQTVYARHEGSIAAPTAGLHFTDTLLQRLRDRQIQTAEVTLHVGSGTFAPVKHEDLSQHRMHVEWCDCPPETAEAIRRTREQGGRVVAVGTTSLRTLESAALLSHQRGLDGLQTGSFETQLFIRPGLHTFRACDALITNFHLPRSTLLMLVSAFAGFERMQAAYAHAVQQRYRFFSYGDAMLLERSEAN